MATSRRWFGAAAFCAALMAGNPARAQTTATLDGTTGSNTVSTAYDTTGNLSIGLGFFVDYLIVAGGGGGGGDNAGGGGGGGLLTGSTAISQSSHAITVGAGGSAGTTSTRGGNGGNSSAFSFEAIGGGGGAAGNTNALARPSVGGSGGGGEGESDGSLKNGAAGTAGQGFAGGNGSTGGGGGGGGAGAAGTNANGANGGKGGDGLQISINGTATYYAGGGGGASDNNSTFVSEGGLGGGGQGKQTTGGNGTNDLGGGGGGATFIASAAGGTGGSGIVIVRYTGAAIPNVGGTATTFTGDGTNGGEAEVTYNVNTFKLADSGAAFDLSGVDFDTRLGATLTGVISGTGDLTYAGPGTLALAAANTFTGSARATGGTLNIGNANALQNATLDLATGDAGTIAFTVAGPTTYTLGGLAGGQNLVLDGSSLVIGGNDTSTSYVGDISGVDLLTKTGAGTLTLAGANAFAVGTVVDSGAITAASATAFGGGTVTLAGGGLSLGNGVTLNNSIVLDESAANTSLGVFLPVEFLLVGGGGGGGGDNGGGGGGGGVVSGSSSLVGSAYAVEVGAGGAGGDASTAGSAGGNSLFDSFTALGGGRGASGNTGQSASSGGSGGGGDGEVNKTGAAGTSGQGFAGGNGWPSTEGSGGGGGGAGGAGNNALSEAQGGDGGIGISSSITGAQVFYGGGGGGGPDNSATNRSAGGLGGGGAGASGTGLAGTNGLGGGGGGAGWNGTQANGGSGGSGVVVVRYQGAPMASGGTISAGTGSAAGYTLHTFTNTGSSTLAVTSAITSTLGGNISGTGGFTLSTLTTLVLTGTNTYAGETVIAGGALQIGDGGASGTLGTGAVTNNAALAFNRSDSSAVANTISGSGTVTKTGLGQLTLSGNNTYKGPTAVSAGVLELASTVGGAAADTASVSVAENATLLISQSGQVNNSAAVTLSGGTITRGAGVSEVFGSLNITGSGILDFGTGAVGNLTFGTYQNNQQTESALLTLNNFMPGNSFTFSNALFAADGSNVGSYFSFGTGYINSSIINNGGSSFTITAIPEPSTVLAAIGLAGLMLWPARRCLFHQADRSRNS